MSSKNELFDVVVKALSVPVDQVNETLEYQAIPEWDSVTHLLVITEIEHHYNISIDMVDILEMSSVIKIIEFLEKYGIQID